MPLRGNLQSLRLGDVLQTILASSGRGLLRVRSGSRFALLHVGEGGLRLLEPQVLDDRMIVDAFVHRGAVPAEVFERAKRLAGSDRKASILETLLIGGSIDRQSFNALLMEAAEDAILDVLAWTEGDFTFEEGAHPDGTRGRVAEVALDASGLLLRAAQRLDELGAVAERIGTNALLVMPEATGRTGRLDGTAKLVLSRLDGVRLLDEIALEGGIRIFEVRKAAAALVETGAARLPTAIELADRANTREEAGDVRGAGGLLLQWQGRCPDDPQPFEASVALAARTGRGEDESTALRALGRLLLRTNRPTDALAVFGRLEAKRPGERDAVDGQRLASKATGDVDTFVRTSKRLAAEDLAGDDAPRAADLLGELLAVRPDDLEARLMRCKALVRAGRSGEAALEVEQLVEALPARCTKRVDREAASYARGAIAHLAPDRGDLMARITKMLDAPQRAKQRLALAGALLFVLAGVGFVAWPKSARALLAEAQAAADRGELAVALDTLDHIQAEHPGTPEASDAASLRRRWLPGPAPTASNPVAAVAPILEAAAKAGAAFPRWPHQDAVATADALILSLRAVGGADVAVPRRQATERVAGPFGDAVAALRHDAQMRRDALDGAAALVQRASASADAIGDALDRARSAMDPTWPARAQHATEAARRLVGALDEALLPVRIVDDVRALEAEVVSATRAVTARAEDVTKLAREHHRLTVLDAYETALTDGSRRLSRGDLDGARAEHGRLRELLDTTQRETSLRTLLDGFERRGIVEFLGARENLVKAIDEGLAAAREAERTGNLGGAATQYARLVRQFPQVRFDEIFTIPLRVIVVPTTAQVTLNTKPAEATDGATVVRYGWGSSATLTVAAEGYETASVVLDTASQRPRADLQVRLAPKRRWSSPLPGTVEAPLLGVDGFLIVCTRSGRIECRSVADGKVRWTVETRCVEGIRGRPVVMEDRLWVPLLDGRVARVEMATGGALAPLQLRERPVGDAAALAGRVAFALDDALAVYTDGTEPRYVSLPGSTTAGVLASHGAFWVGDAAGGVSRVDAASLAVKTVHPGTTHAPVVGLAADTQRVYALAEDGTLYAFGGADSEVAWTRPGLGDVVGQPAAAGAVVAVTDRSGRVLVLDAATGAPKAVRETGSPARGGLVGVNGHVVAALSDGRLWIYDAVADSVDVDSPLEGTARVGPAILSDGLAVPAGGNGIAVVPLPH